MYDMSHTSKCSEMRSVIWRSKLENTVSVNATCVSQGPDLEGIRWNHVTESERVFFF